MERVPMNNSSVMEAKVQDGKLVYIFDKKQHAQTLLHNLIVMHDNDEGNLTDVVITSKENEQFYFHGPILAALSKNLEENLLKRGLGSAASKNTKTVMEENFSSEAVQCLWDYAYTSVVTLTPSNINEVKELAEHYGIVRLMHECTELLDRETLFGEGQGKEEVGFKDVPEIILDRLHNFHEKKVMCTAVITDCLSSTRFPCHGAVIAAACNEFFLELVFGDSNSIIDVDGYTLQSIGPFLQYLYTAKLMIDQETVLPLLGFAAKFNIPSIGNACCSWLKFTLTANNALALMTIAQDLLNKEKNQSSGKESQDDVSFASALADLYQHARAFVLRNFFSVQESVQYLGISLEELIDLLADDDLGVHSEEDIVYAVMKWVCCSPETRASDLPDLLQAVRLEYISPEFLEAMLHHDLMLTNSRCIQLIEDAQTIVLPSRPRRRSTVQRYDVG